MTKRYEIESGRISEINGDGVAFVSLGFACDLLNRQAAQIEVLREFVQKNPQAVPELMVQARDRFGLWPDGQKEADAILTALGIEKRLT